MFFEMFCFLEAELRVAIAVEGVLEGTDEGRWRAGQDDHAIDASNKKR